MLEKILPIRAFRDNYIWAIISPSLSSVWVIDPGEAAPVMRFLAEHRLVLAGILLTHHHADHSGGISALLAEWPGIPVIGGMQSPVTSVTQRVSEGVELACGSLRFNVLAIPGHTLDHIAFYNERILFCGDTLFSAGCGRVFEGTHAEMYASLRKLRQLNDQTSIYCGHEYTLQNLRFAEQVEPENRDILHKIRQVEMLVGENKTTLPSTIGEEKKINPFLRCDQPTVIKAAEHYANQPLSTPEDVFACLREWKSRL